MNDKKSQYCTHTKLQTHNHYGHNAAKNLNLYRSVGPMPYNKKLSYLTRKKINTVHVLEACLPAAFSFHSGVEHGAIPFPNTWGKYCTSGRSRFIIFGIQRCEVLISLFFIPPLRDPTLLCGCCREEFSKTLIMH